MGSKFEIRAVYLKLNYFDNRVDNEFQPLDYGVGNGNASTIQQVLKTKGISPQCRLKLDSIEEGGTILLPIDFDPNAYNTIVLIDKRSNWAYAYFLADTGRVFNELVEYKLTLNYYATYGEDFLFGNSTRKLWHKMNVYKSNQIPIPSTSYDGLNAKLVSPDIQKWSWMNQSISELPETLRIDANNESVVNYNTNIFNATYIPTNSLFSNATVSLTRFNQTDQFLVKSPRIRELTIRARSYTLDVACLYNYNWTILPNKEGLSYFGNWNTRTRLTEYTDSELVNIVQNAIREWDTDTWILFSANIVVADNNVQSAHYYGEINTPFGQETPEDKKKGATPVIFAYPISKAQIRDNFSIVSLMKLRFGEGGFNYLGITKLKSQNWMQNQKPKAVMFISPADFNCRDQSTEGLNIRDRVVACPVFTTYASFMKFNIPNAYRSFGWWHRVQSQITTSNWTWAAVPKSIDQVIGSIKLCSGVTRAVINTGSKWLTYDWTSFNSRYFDVFYTNLGYEMIWLEPKFDLNNPYQGYNIKPWKENKMSLGLSTITEKNAGTFNNSEMTAIKQNSNQWQVAQNQASFNYSRAVGTAPFETLKNIINPVGLSNVVGNIENARYDMLKLPALRQDLQNSNTGTYPAGNSWMFDWEVIGQWVIEWNTPFIIDVYNYVTRNGWYNKMGGWSKNMLTQQYASALITDASGSYSIAGYIAFAQFYRDLNQMVRNVSVIAREKGIFIPHTVKEWFADWFDKGVRIYYQPDEAVRSKTWTLAEVEDMARTTAVVKSDANEKEDVICAKERQSIQNQQESASENIQGDVEGASKSRAKTEARSKSRARTSSRKSQANN